MPKKELIDLIRVWCVDCQREAGKAKENKFQDQKVRWACHGCQDGGLAATASSKTSRYIVNDQVKTTIRVDRYGYCSHQFNWDLFENQLKGQVCDVADLIWSTRDA